MIFIVISAELIISLVKINLKYWQNLQLTLRKKISSLSRNMTNKACQVNFDEMNLETCYKSDCQHCLKSVQIRSFFWSVFSRIRIERYFVSLCIQFEYGKIRTRKTPYLDTFHAVQALQNKKMTGKTKLVRVQINENNFIIRSLFSLKLCKREEDKLSYKVKKILTVKLCLKVVLVMK